jgi:hypothetical protein
VVSGGAGVMATFAVSGGVEFFESPVSVTDTEGVTIAFDEVTTGLVGGNCGDTNCEIVAVAVTSVKLAEIWAVGTAGTIWGAAGGATSAGAGSGDGPAGTCFTTDAWPRTSGAAAGVGNRI